MHDDNTPLDTTRILNDLYSLQASLSMCCNQLARMRPEEWNHDLLNSLLTMHWAIQRQLPSLTRH